MYKKGSDNNSSNCHCNGVQAGVNKAGARLRKKKQLFQTEELRLSERSAAWQKERNQLLIFFLK